jgi:GNAT superfamily N-acetyltransferase
LLIREATPDDLPFLHEMWHTAAFWQPEVFSIPAEQALEIDEIARYIAGWGRDGDVALVATADDRPIGAVWFRSFPATRPGYGFVDTSTPELAIAVVGEARRRGVATALLDAMIDVARGRGVRALSLSVNATNPSRRIYQRAGFVDVPSPDEDSYVMVLEL